MAEVDSDRIGVLREMGDKRSQGWPARLDQFYFTCTFAWCVFCEQSKWSYKRIIIWGVIHLEGDLLNLYKDVIEILPI